MFNHCPTVFPDPSWLHSWASLARCYPDGFVRRLMTLWQGRRELPMQHLRHRPKVDLTQTDKELFENIPLGDPWAESGIHHVFKYLWNCKHVEIPDSWLHTMKQFNAELSQVVPRRLNWISLYPKKNHGLKIWIIVRFGVHTGSHIYACTSAQVCVSEQERFEYNQNVQ